MHVVFMAAKETLMPQQQKDLTLRMRVQTS